jgi:hypothetical protein
LAAAALSLPARAAGPEHYQVRHAGDLVRLCDAQPSDADHPTALAFCHGVLSGAYGYYLASTEPADRFVCVPDPAPTRTQVARGFVAWAKARPQLMQKGAIDVLFNFAAEAYPCKR